MKRLALILWGICVAFLICGAARAQLITNQPQSITVNNASTAEFAVGVTTNATNFQWQFNGTNLTNGGNISGASSATLTLEDLDSNQMGNYSVIVNNSVTSSPPAVLTIVPGTIVRFQLSGVIGGGTNTVDVQLFDHDKPATVQNFLHYIIVSGAYTNMFFDRCATNFVLQGGDYGASNQTATTPPLTGWKIFDRYTVNTQQSRPFPHQVDNEFGVGPLIHNRFGTVAMAKIGSQPDSASSAFFFNLADNTGAPAFLDSQNGGFTVFGRILNGTNVLQYFNGLASGGIVANTSMTADTGVVSLGSVPVNYIGTNAPANSNLVFCNFVFTNGAPLLDTNPPTVAITSPVATTPLTNALQGTAQDNIGLANVFCVLTPQAAVDGTYPSPYTNGSPETNYATGTTNWALALSPGVYGVAVQAQDGAGNLSRPTNAVVTNSAIVVAGNGTVTSSGINAVGYPFQNGHLYNLVASPGSNQVFVSWTGPNLTVFSPALPFFMINNYFVTATFISNGLPNSIAFTYPPSNGVIGTNAFNITGTISNIPAPPATVTCQIVSQTTSSNLGFFPANVGASNWSLAMSNLPVGNYAVEATAVDQASNSTVITEYFSIATNAGLQLNVVGPGTVSGVTNGMPILVGAPFQATATPNNAGDLFYTWSYGTNVSLAPSFTNTMAAGVTLTATFVSNAIPNSIAFTSPPTNVILSNTAVLVSGIISNAPAPPVSLTCQIFSQATMLSVTPALSTNGTTNWSFIQSNLVAGSYVAQVLAVDQASNSTVITENFTATVDTNLPVVTVLSPAPNALLSTITPVIISGTASDSVVPLVAVGIILAPQRAADGAIPNGGSNAFKYGVGTSNWSVSFDLMAPGVYTNFAEALDAAGNLGVQTNLLTNTAVLINGNGTVSLTQGGAAKPNPVGYPLQPNVSYQLQATPGAGQAFVCWSAGAYTTTNTVQSFTMQPGLLWTATFVPTNTPKGISFTYPAANAGLSTNSFLLKGRMTPAFSSARINCRITSLTTTFSVGPLQAASGSTTWSATVSNLPPDNYVVLATGTNASGASATVSERFTVLPFTQVAGTYTGLFISTNTPVSPTNSGSLTLSVQPSGLLTGKLVFPAYVPIPIYPMLFRNNYFTTGLAQFGLTNFHHDTWSGNIYLDLSGSNDVVYGAITSAGWSARLFCYRAVTKLSANTTPATGKYTLSLQPGNQTNGIGTNGYASLTVGRTGILTLSGALPDNTTFSGSTRVSKEGYWPLCAVPAGDGSKGLLIGWGTFTNLNSSSGQLYWYKAAKVGAYYTNGVGVLSNMLLSAPGTNFVPPAPRSVYPIVFGGGTIAPPLTNSLRVSDAGQFVVTGGAEDKLKISLSAAGILTGSLWNSNDNKTLRFKGVFVSPLEGGSGFIPDANGQTGYFNLAP